MKRLLTILMIVFIESACCGKKEVPVPGAGQSDQYKHLIEGKSVAVVANQTSMVGQTNLVEYLLGMGINIRVIFIPEHGYREMASDGASIGDGTDTETGIPMKSLYGVRQKPSPEDLEGIDVVIYDIQDVGARFYTYISTLHYVMEACAENNVK